MACSQHRDTSIAYHGRLDRSIRELNHVGNSSCVNENAEIATTAVWPVLTFSGILVP